MNALTPMVGEMIRRIETKYDGVLGNESAWEFTAFVAAAFLPEYVEVSWDGMKLGLFDPVDGNGADEPATGYRLKVTTVADVKSVVILNAAYKR